MNKPKKESLFLMARDENTDFMAVMTTSPSQGKQKLKERRSRYNGISL